jgi:putative protein-disulfide isomerase
MTILYFFDPLCGWCYGFSPVIKKLQEEFSDAMSFRAVCGGMITGDRVRPIADKADYIRSAIPRLEQMTGVTFGEKYYKNILDSSDYVSDSTPPSIAVNALKMLTHSNGIEIASALKELHFQDGMRYDDEETYRKLAGKFGVQDSALLEAMNLSEIEDMTFSDFELTHLLEVNGFPSVCVEFNGQYYQIANGYTHLDTLREMLTKMKTLLTAEN